MHQYIHDIAAYRTETAHLSTLEHGIYRQLLDWYFLDERPIPTETQSVIRRLRLGSQQEAEALQNVLQDLFEPHQDGWHHPRCDHQIALCRARAQRNKANGIKGGRPRKTQQEPTRNPDETHTEPKITQSVSVGFQDEKCVYVKHKVFTKEKACSSEKGGVGEKTSTAPVTRKRSSPPPRPEDVDEQTWADWTSLRASKRAPVTPTVLASARAEAGKAGLSLTEFLTVWCLRGTQGLQADWLRPSERRPARPAESFRQQDERAAQATWEAMTGRRWPASADGGAEIIDITPQPQLLIAEAS